MPTRVVAEFVLLLCKTGRFKFSHYPENGMLGSEDGHCLGFLCKALRQSGFENRISFAHRIESDRLLQKLPQIPIETH